MNSSAFWEGRLYAFLAVNKMRRLQQILIRGTTRCVESSFLCFSCLIQQTVSVWRHSSHFDLENVRRILVWKSQAINLFSRFCVAMYWNTDATLYTEDEAPAHS